MRFSEAITNPVSADESRVIFDEYVFPAVHSTDSSVQREVVRILGITLRSEDILTRTPFVMDDAKRALVLGAAVNDSPEVYMAFINLLFTHEVDRAEILRLMSGFEEIPSKISSTSTDWLAEKIVAASKIQKMHQEYETTKMIARYRTTCRPIFSKKTK